VVVGNQNAIKELATKGVAFAHRVELWLTCSGARKKLEENPGYYRDILSRFEQQEDITTREIDKDVFYTFPGHVLYQTEQGRTALRNIMTAYHWRNITCGYAHHICAMCAVLLLFMDEESAFWMLATIIEDLIPKYYTANFIGAQVDLAVLEEMMAEKLPKLYAHIQQHDFSLSLLVVEWFLSLFATYLPTETLLRVWDAIFVGGKKYMFKATLAVFKYHETTLLKLTDFNEFLAYLKTMSYVTWDADNLMRLAITEFGSMTKILKLRVKLAREMEETNKKKTTKSKENFF